MKIILILIFITVMAAFSSQTVPDEKNQRQISTKMKTSLRTFNVFPKQLWELRKLYEYEEKLKEEIENKRLETNKKLLLKEEAKRQRIVQFLIGSQKQASSFHRDFQTNRFF
jgi:hypothetical protein